MNRTGEVRGEDEPAILYDGPRIRITSWKENPNVHVVYMHEQRFLNGGAIIPRGYLENYVNTPIDQLESKVTLLNPELREHMREHDIPIEEMAFAFAQALMAHKAPKPTA